MLIIGGKAESARKLKDDYGIKRVGLMSYVEHDDNTPDLAREKTDQDSSVKVI